MDSRPPIDNLQEHKTECHSSTQNNAHTDLSSVLSDIESNLVHASAYIVLIQDQLEFDCHDPMEALHAQGIIYSLLRALEREIVDSREASSEAQKSAALNVKH